MKYKEFYPFELTPATKKTDNLLQWLQVAHELAPLIKQVSPLLQQFSMLASLLHGISGPVEQQRKNTHSRDSTVFIPK
ncbi:hypothetical protein CF394_04725 [Tetzosporium hominis]|uniref:Uncharacterized protein n=1 Tax=Tetzosporium hominis TaxID=2020506 RepID=A0A264W5L0_9BACL|nr:hypothetical protein [Tetzosporium hominis]OZS78845.1 hypothetical protein CF394_04725 [Tetzosporium hominis]